MRNESSHKFAVGDILYKVSRFEDDGKLHLCRIELTDIIITKTQTGRERKPIYKGRAINFSAGKEEQTEGVVIDPDWYWQSATNAVNDSLRSYFEKRVSNGCTQSSEERLLMAIFGEKPCPKIAAAAIVDVIYDLKNYHALFAEAFAEDDKRVQEIEVNHEEH